MQLSNEWKSAELVFVVSIDIIKPVKMTFVLCFILNNELLKQEVDQVSLLEFRYIIRRSGIIWNSMMNEGWETKKIPTAFVLSTLYKAATILYLLD